MEQSASSENFGFKESKAIEYSWQNHSFGSDVSYASHTGWEYCHEQPAIILVSYWRDISSMVILEFMPCCRLKLNQTRLERNVFRHLGSKKTSKRSCAYYTNQ